MSSSHISPCHAMATMMLALETLKKCPYDVALKETLANIPNSSKSQRNDKSNVGRKSENYHPQFWGDRFTKPSLDELKPDAQARHRANELKEDVKRMLHNVNDPQQELNLIDAIHRLGVAYHFESGIESALLRMHNSFTDGKDNNDDLHTVALRLRLLRQEGYNVSSSM
ncbi:hypothetical protein AAC387_Pa10g0950 [Persea americana]